MPEPVKPECCCCSSPDGGQQWAQIDAIGKSSPPCGACAKNCLSDAITVNAGVGCVAAIIKGARTGLEPVWDSGPESCCLAVSLNCYYRRKSAGPSYPIFVCLAKCKIARAAAVPCVAHHLVNKRFGIIGDRFRKRQ